MNPGTQRALDLVGGHCDLEERLPLVPPSARLRGVWFRILERQLAQRDLLERYREIFPGPSPSSLAFHPVADFLPRAAVAGALVAGPAGLHDGLFALTHENSAGFANTLVARTLLKFLANDPRKLTQQAIASRRQTTTYGSWEVIDWGEGFVEVRLREEYVWIESYMRGAAHGSYVRFGEEVRSEARLDDRFHGVIRVWWR
ncbi:MAG: TIGR02265 family protein [Myxococcota bacterium]|nr:TIGR02265 family protein [Myxococcota bacterium]